MADFNICIEWVLPHEAGTPPRYTIEPDPTPGEPNALACAGVNSVAYPADFAEIVALPEAERPARVALFYQTQFWNQWYGRLTSNAVAAYTLDSAVNEGPGTGVKELQLAVNAVAGPETVTVDDAWGPLTVTATNACNPTQLLAALKNVRDAMYQEIGGPDLAAWLARAALMPPFA